MSRNHKLLLSFYGDDFTGSTDSMEALAMNGIKTVLFLHPPTPAFIEQHFPDIQAIGVAGISRAMGPDQMERELRPIFEMLKQLPAPVVHYKMCSTFDSSPAVGSIGKAIDTGAAVFDGQPVVPLLVGAPALKRYTLFGNHFASVADETYRLDRHPTMSCHPVTPMGEADLRVHLGKQTERTVALMDILDLEGSGERVRERLARRVEDNPGVLLYDVLDDKRLQRAGELIWESALSENRFVVGSSGVEYALTAHWQELALASKDDTLRIPLGEVDRVFAVSGSCSPVTESQIRYALRHGFSGIRVDVARLIDPLSGEKVRRELLSQVTNVLDQGGSPLVYTAMGSEDNDIENIRGLLTEAGFRPADTGRLLGEQLGRLTREVVERKQISRIVVAGGDTSGFVTRELGIYALECLMSIDPGGPLCRSYSDDPRFDGMQIVLKGGQVGKSDYFVRVLEGR